MTIAQQLKVTTFPFEIKDKNGHTLYYENSDGDWSRYEYDKFGNEVYFENSNGVWSKSEYKMLDSYANCVYHETSRGIVVDNRKWPFSKAIVEVSLEEIAKQLGIKVEQLRIKD